MGWFSSIEGFLRQSAGTEEQDVLYTWGQSVARLRGRRKGKLWVEEQGRTREDVGSAYHSEGPSTVSGLEVLLGIHILISYLVSSLYAFSEVLHLL